MSLRGRKALLLGCEAPVNGAAQPRPKEEGKEGKRRRESLFLTFGINIMKGFLKTQQIWKVQTKGFKSVPEKIYPHNLMIFKNPLEGMVSFANQRVCRAPEAAKQPRNSAQRAFGFLFRPNENCAMVHSQTQKPYSQASLSGDIFITT